MKNTNKKKQIETEEQAVDISKCFEIQRNLRLLFKNLYESKVQIEADQNRLKALQYIFETDILKIEFYKKLKKFERIYKTKQYQNCCYEIYGYIQKRIKEIAEKENKVVISEKIEDMQNMYSIQIYDNTKEEYNIKGTITYIDTPLLFLFESSGFYNIKAEDCKIYRNLVHFYGNYAQEVFSSLYDINKWKDDKTRDEVRKIRANLFEIYKSYVEYKLSIRNVINSIDYISYDDEKQSSFNFRETVVYSSLCGVLNNLDIYISDLIRSSLKIKDDLSEVEKTKLYAIEHPELSILEIAENLGKSKSTVEKQLGGKKKLLKGNKNIIH